MQRKPRRGGSVRCKMCIRDRYDSVLDAMKHCGNSGRGASDASLDASRKRYEARRCRAEFFGGDDAVSYTHLDVYKRQV